MSHLASSINVGIGCTLLVSLDLLTLVLLEEVVKLYLCSIKSSAYLALYILDRKLLGRGMMIRFEAPIIIPGIILCLYTSEAVKVLVILLMVFAWSAYRAWQYMLTLTSVTLGNFFNTAWLLILIITTLSIQNFIRLTVRILM